MDAPAAWRADCVLELLFIRLKADIEGNQLCIDRQQSLK